MVKKPPELVKDVLTARVRPDIKQALAQAAIDESRTIAAQVEKILAEWLKRKGYLK